MKSISFVGISVGALAVSACALEPYGLLYTSAVGPGAYPRPATHGELSSYLTSDPPRLCIGPRVTAEKCSWSVLGLVAAGDRSIDSALRQARDDSHASVLVDVTIDHGYATYLGVYSQNCTRVSGVALVPPPCVIQAPPGK
jgi:hypothetical protein